MDYIAKQLEDALIARIQAIPGIIADVRAVEYQELMQAPQRDTVLVVWRRNETGNQLNNSGLRQREIIFDLLLSKLNLRTADIYPWLQLLEPQLIGWEPDGIDTMSPFEMSDSAPNNKYFEDGFWTCRSTLKILVPYFPS